jgi:diamine N-acetyltransferase
LEKESNVHLRIGDVTDASALSAIARETFYESFAHENDEEDMRLYLETNFLPQQIEDELKDKRTTFFLAYAGEELAGYAKVSLKAPEKMDKDVSGLEVERIYVRSRHQRRNIGQKLLDQCLAHARAYAVEVVWLGVWQHNKKAVAFYKRNSFVQYGEHDFVLGKDVQTDWLMMLEIKRPD